MSFTCMGALFWRSELTCLSMGTGSAFKRQTLQKHCPTKAHHHPKWSRQCPNLKGTSKQTSTTILPLVWSSASPAARPRPRSRVTKHFETCRRRDKYHSRKIKEPSEPHHKKYPNSGTKKSKNKEASKSTHRFLKK